LLTPSGSPELSERICELLIVAHKLGAVSADIELLDSLDFFQDPLRFLLLALSLRFLPVAGARGGFVRARVLRADVGSFIRWVSKT
jgi:hypothetical protein